MSGSDYEISLSLVQPGQVVSSRDPAFVPWYKEPSPVVIWVVVFFVHELKAPPAGSKENLLLEYCLFVFVLIGKDEYPFWRPHKRSTLRWAGCRQTLGACRENQERDRQVCTSGYGEGPEQDLPSLRVESAVTAAARSAGVVARGALGPVRKCRGRRPEFVGDLPGL